MGQTFRLVLASLLIAICGPLVVSAQVATPSGGDASRPEECRIAPRSLESVRRIISALPTEVPATSTQPMEDMVEVGGPPDVLDVTLDGTPLVVAETEAAITPSSSAAPAAAPLAGGPVEPETVTQIAAMARLLAACANAGDSLRYYALFTDAALSRLLANVVPEGNEEIFLESLTTPVSVSSEERQPVPTIEDVRMLPDGRVAALLTLTEPGLPQAREWFVFVEADNGWLIDDVISASPAPSSGTPSR